MGWLTSCDGTNAIVTAGGSWSEERPQLDSTGTGTYEVVIYKRTHDTATTEYVGVTLSTAQSYVSDHSDDTGVKSCTYCVDSEGGGYRVIVETETVGDWEKVT